MGLAVVAAGAEGTALWFDRGDDGAGPVAVATVPADTGAVTVEVAATGTVRAATTRSLGFAVDGTVAKMAVRAGSKVKAGAVLAALDGSDAAGAVEDARDTLRDAEERLAAAKAKAAAAKAKAKAKATAKATTKDAAVRAATGLDAIFTARRRVNQAVADLAEAEVALAGTTITAPIAGTVMTVTGQVGSQVGLGATVVTLADTYRMQVAASFPEADAGSLAVRQPATVTLADRPGVRFAAEVVQVDPVGTSDGTRVTYGVLLSFGTQPPGLLVGQSAAVEVRTGEVASALRVPSTAVRDAGDGRGVVRIPARGGTPATRTVSVGLRGGRYTQITGGLAAGEQVVRSW